MIGSLLIILTATLAISLYARGYRLSLEPRPSVRVTGLLSATSTPKSASVYLDDRLTTATDDTISLPPGQYSVKIVKDGYLPWQKTITIKPETVFQTDARLYRSAPDLRPISLSGAIHPAISPDGAKIVYSVASASASKDNGLYLLELSGNPLSLTRNSPRQLSPNLLSLDWSKFNFEFSPNSRQIIASSPSTSYLLNLDAPISPASLYDISLRLPLIREDWVKNEQEIIRSRLDRLPSVLRPLVATASARNILLSSDENQILYLSQTDGSLPSNLISPPPAQSTQVQNRQIKKDNYYVYDLLNDTNFLIGSHSDLLHPSWLANSNNLVFVRHQQIRIIESDATNEITIFSGQFDPNTVFPWSDGSRIITLLSPFAESGPNLYAIYLR